MLVTGAMYAPREAVGVQIGSRGRLGWVPRGLPCRVQAVRTEGAVLFRAKGVDLWIGFAISSTVPLGLAIGWLLTGTFSTRALPLFVGLGLVGIALACTAVLLSAMYDELIIDLDDYSSTWIYHRLFWKQNRVDVVEPITLMRCSIRHDRDVLGIHRCHGVVAVVGHHLMILCAQRRAAKVDAYLDTLPDRLRGRLVEDPLHVVVHFLPPNT